MYFIFIISQSIYRFFLDFQNLRAIFYGLINLQSIYPFLTEKEENHYQNHFKPTQGDNSNGFESLRGKMSSSEFEKKNQATTIVYDVNLTFSQNNKQHLVSLLYQEIGQYILLSPGADPGSCGRRAHLPLLPPTPLLLPPLYPWLRTQRSFKGGSTENMGVGDQSPPAPTLNPLLLSYYEPMDQNSYV